MTEDESVVQRSDRNMITTLIRETRRPRRLRFIEVTAESQYQSEEEIVLPAEVSALNQHLEALHLGAPGQKVHTPRQTENSAMESGVTL